MNIKVKDSTQPTEILKKTKPWFNGPHTFSSLKIDTPKQPTSLGISVGDSTTPSEKIG